jgi:carboxypeptidase PM20D1
MIIGVYRLIFLFFILVLKVPMSGQDITDIPICVHSGHDGIEARPFFPSDISIDFTKIGISDAAVLLSEYIRFESYSGNESDAGQFICNKAKDLGLYVTELRGPDREFNVAVSLFPLEDELPNIVFLNHIDVVNSGELHNWKYPPFEGVIAEGQIWGRGAYDNKGIGIAQLMALHLYSRESGRRDNLLNYTALFLSGEEIFHPGGAAYVAEHYLDLLNPILCIGEGPPGVLGLIPAKPDVQIFPISVVNKRVLWLKLSLDYESSGHGSVPPSNYPNKDMIAAIHNLLESKQPIELNIYNASLLHGLGDLESGIKGFFMKNIHVFKPFARKIIRKDPLYNALFSNTIGLTEIKNFSDGYNSIPNRVEATLDCRLMPGTNTDTFIKDLKKKLKNANVRVEVIKETPDAPPTDPRIPAYKILEEAIMKSYPKAVILPILLQSASDSNFFRVKGIPVICSVPALMTPDLLQKVHGTNERIPITSLDEAVDIIYRFMKNYYRFYAEENTFNPTKDIFSEN